MYATKKGQRRAVCACPDRQVFHALQSILILPLPVFPSCRIYRVRSLPYHGSNTDFFLNQRDEQEMTLLSHTFEYLNFQHISVCNFSVMLN